MDFIDPIAHAAIEATLNAVWQGAALTLMVWCLLRVMRRTNATTRHVIWAITLAAVAALPVLLMGVSMSPGSKPSEIVVTSDSPVYAPAQALSESRARDVMPDVMPEAAALSKGGEIESTSRAYESKLRQGRSPLRVDLPAGRWSRLLFIVWMMVSALMLGRVAWSFVHLRGLRKRCAPLSRERQPWLDGHRAACNISYKISLYESREVSMPMSFGLMRPAIVIPTPLVNRLTEAELNQVLLHEMAHILRRDNWANFAQKLIEAVFFFHPAVLWLGRRLDLEREIACDDRVVSITGQSKPYAACLVRLVELGSLGRQPVPASGIAMAKRQTFRRVEMLLDRKRDASPRVFRVVLFATVAVLALALAQGAHVAPMIALSHHAASSAQAFDSLAPSPAQEDQRGSEERAATSLMGRAESASAVDAGPKNTAASDDLPQNGNDNNSALPQSSSEREPATPAPAAAQRLDEPPLPPVPPTPPAVGPSPPETVPVPPVAPLGAPQAQESRYAELTRKYQEQMKRYHDQMKEYERGMAKYQEQMARYQQQMSVYNERMKQYQKEMEEYTKRVFSLVPGVVRGIIAEEVRSLYTSAGTSGSFDASSRARFDGALDVASASLAKQIISDYQDFKINRPAGRITLVSSRSAGYFRDAMRAHFNAASEKAGINADGAIRSYLNAAADRIAPSLQSLVVYRFEDK
jgi:beta-lactamase regulating signal transducer with metallopeptidase domain